MSNLPSTSENSKGFVQSDVIIIGAGPAGLAVGGCLQRAGVSFLILDSAAEVGSRWVRHYDRLHLHTAKRFSALPYKPFPADYPRHPSRQQFVDYLTDYARSFQSSLRLNQIVTAINQNQLDDFWEVTTTDTTYRARSVVVATGYSHIAYSPEWPDQALFAGQIMHSSDYKNGKSLRGKRVLVVGFGNSGAEIAIDLWENGAQSHLSVRNAVNVSFRELLGVPYQYLMIPFNGLPPAMVDMFTTPVNRLKNGSLTSYGLKKLPYGVATQVKKYHEVPVLDIGIMRLIRQKQVVVHPGIDRFTANGVVFADGHKEAFDTIVLATGYRPQLAPFLPRNYTLLDDDGYPLTSGQPTAAPGLYFCGFHNAAVGLIYTIGIEARHIASHIMDRVPKST